ncbi:MAG: thioredoxin family protein [Candidatus Woesearchaeota archaeon]
MRAWIAFGILAAVILLINFGPLLLSNNCPKKTYGAGGETIKYFSSPFCLACWVQKPVIEKVAAEQDVTFEEYDVDFCREAAKPHYVRGVPAFKINDTIKYGLRNEEQLLELIK